ncbi:hypothetical protein BaRGS_00005654, partial [Batillaria attramentaria]
APRDGTRFLLVWWHLQSARRMSSAQPPISSRNDSCCGPLIQCHLPVAQFSAPPPPVMALRMGRVVLRDDHDEVPAMCQIHVPPHGTGAAEVVHLTAVTLSSCLHDTDELQVDMEVISQDYQPWTRGIVESILLRLRVVREMNEKAKYRDRIEPCGRGGQAM